MFAASDLASAVARVLSLPEGVASTGVITPDGSGAIAGLRNGKTEGRLGCRLAGVPGFRAGPHATVTVSTPIARHRVERSDKLAIAAGFLEHALAQPENGRRR